VDLLFFNLIANYILKVRIYFVLCHTGVLYVNYLEDE
jgi:hypothetical protein